MNTFEDKYDELLGLIKAANKDCFVYPCKVVPRGDVDVTRINASIENFANHWRMQHVKVVASTNEGRVDRGGRGYGDKGGGKRDRGGGERGKRGRGVGVVGAGSGGEWGREVFTNLSKE